MGSRATVSAGSLLAGRYRLVEPLPDAGVGNWRARDDIGDRDVAAREIPVPAGLGADEQEVVRQHAVREVRGAARLRHVGIVQIYDVVEHEDVPWMVAELVPSPSLDHVLRTGGPLTPVEAARIGLRVLDALEVADAAGVRHRDLTPASVLLGGDGRVAVTGFGLTPNVPAQASGRPATVLGSVDFVSPERARGVPTDELESDLWSLGATLYAAVEGRLPFHRDGALATLTAVVTDEPPPPRRAGALRPVIDGLLAKDPAHRLRGAEARRMLDGVVRGVPVSPAPRLAPSRPAEPVGTAPNEAARPDRTVGVTSGAGPAGVAVGSAGQPARGPGGEPADAPAGTAGGVTEPVPAAQPPLPAGDPPAPAAGPPAPAAGPPGESASAPAAPQEFHDPEVAAALAAFEAALPTRMPAGPAPTTGAEPRERQTSRPAAADPSAADSTDNTDNTDNTDSDTDNTDSDTGDAPAASAEEGGTAPKPAAGRPDAAPSPGTAARPPDAPTAAGSARPTPPRVNGTPPADQRGASPAERSAPPVVNGRANRHSSPGPSPAGQLDTTRTAPATNGHASRLSSRPLTASPPRDIIPPGPQRPRISDRTGPGRPGSGRRSILTVIAVVLGVVAAVLIPFAVDRARDTDGPGDPVAPQAAPSQAPATDREAGSSTSPQPPAAPPPGFRLHRDRTGFSIAVPIGWREQRDGTLVDFRDPTSGRFIRIDQRTKPRPDPYEDWLEQEPAMKAKLTGYDLIRIAVVQYRGWPTADWEFTWGARGVERTHVLIRNVVPDPGRGYALYWSTADRSWAADLPLFDTFARTFSPAEAGR